MERAHGEDHTGDRARVENVGVDEAESPDLDDLGPDGGEEIAVDDV